VAVRAPHLATIDLGLDSRRSITLADEITDVSSLGSNMVEFEHDEI